MKRPSSVVIAFLAASITNCLASDLSKNDPMTPVPLPAQVPASEGIAELPGTRLDYWDTGGEGPAIVLLHVVGSAAGCAVAIDYALSHPERLLSLTLAGGTGGVRDLD